MNKQLYVKILLIIAFDSNANVCKSTVDPNDTVAQVKESLQCWKQLVEKSEADLKLRAVELTTLSRQLKAARTDVEAAGKRAEVAIKLADDKGKEVERMRTEAGTVAAPALSEKPAGAPWQVLTYLLPFPSIDTCKHNSTKLLSDLPEMKQRSQTNQYVSFADSTYTVSVYCLSNSTLVFSAGPSFERVRDLSQGIGKKLDSFR